MKKNNTEGVSFGKRFMHFMKHYSGYVLLALVCAVITVVIVGIGA